MNPIGKSRSDEKTILIADDDPAIRRLIRECFAGQADWRFLEAADGLEAMAVLLKEHVDLLILDLNMPRMNGLEVASFIRRKPELQGLSIIMFTSERDSYTRHKAMAQGIHHYVNKPFNPAEFSRILGTLLAKP